MLMPCPEDHLADNATVMTVYKTTQNTLWGNPAAVFDGECFAR